MPLNSLPIQPNWLSPQLPREGRYVLGPLLGKGGMGEVMEAWDVVLCRTVAIKVLRHMEPTAMIRFMHEAQVQARVVHPNICRIYDIDSSEGSLKIAMQLVQGPNLEQAAPQLSVDEVVTILGQVAEAVHAAHRVNLIHRDIKPSNVLLERTAEGRWVPFLCDFGLALAMGEPALTASQAAIGTPAYMAPEQARGDRALVTPATDVYALGGSLHFALLGYPPGQGEPAPSGRRPAKAGLPKALDTIIQTCLMAAPERRYPTAAALAEDLWRFRNGEPVQGRGARCRRLALPWLSRRHRVPTLVGTVAVVALALSGYLAWMLADWDRQKTLADLFLLEAGSVARRYTDELGQPVHDLRPAQARVRTHMAALSARMAGQGRRAAGPGFLALARFHFLLGEFDLARQALDRAATLGVPEVNLANLRLRVLAGAAMWNPGAEAGPLPVAAAGVGEDDEEGVTAALAAFVHKDYLQSAQIIHRDLGLDPALHLPPGLEAAALCALGRQAFLAGDLAEAQARFQEAKEAADLRCGIWRSHPDLRHARARATLGLAETLMERGLPALPLLTVLADLCDEALRLGPDRQDLREDWLASRFLLAREQARRGQDPEPVLDAGLAFLGSPGKGDPGPESRAARMLFSWQLAERCLRRGEDPGPAMVEALRNAGPTPGYLRDFQAKVLNREASLEEARALDPRPTLDTLLDHCRPQAPGLAGWAPLEDAASAWLQRAEWERGHGLDSSASLENAQAMADRAIQIFPAAPDANALKGLACALEIALSPSRRPLLLPMARARLRLATSGGGRAELVSRLRRELERRS